MILCRLGLHHYQVYGFELTVGALRTQVTRSRCTVCGKVKTVENTW